MFFIIFLPLLEIFTKEFDGSFEIKSIFLIPSFKKMKFLSNFSKFLDNWFNKYKFFAR